MKKKYKIIIIVVAILIIMLPSSLFIPIEHVAMSINTVKGEKKELMDGEETQIYAKLYPGITDGCWEVIGKDGVLFKDESIIDTIKVRGKFPKRLNYDLTLDTIFILNGTFVSDKNRESWQEKGTFEVNDWAVLNSIQRRKYNFLSKTNLTIWDRLSEEVIPVG